MKTTGIFLQVLGLVILGYAVAAGLEEGTISPTLTLTGLILVLGGLFAILAGNRMK